MRGPFSWPARIHPLCPAKTEDIILRRACIQKFRSAELRRRKRGRRAGSNTGRWLTYSLHLLKSAEREPSRNGERVIERGEGDKPVDINVDTSAVGNHFRCHSDVPRDARQPFIATERNFREPRHLYRSRYIEFMVFIDPSVIGVSGENITRREVYAVLVAAPFLGCPLRDRNHLHVRIDCTLHVRSCPILII